MSPFAWIIVALFVGVALWVITSATPKLGKAVAKASSAEDITPILQAVERLRPEGQTAALNHAIRQLWDRYQRPLAIELIKALAEGHGDSLIAQYWLKQVQQVEPELARSELGAKFIETYYRPELAARCGPVG